MQTIGERLEEARKKKGISIREAAEATKIRGDYLSKFENNQFDINLTELYVRGFLRTYAQFLRLPADRIINDYTALGRGELRPRQPSREVYGRMDVSVVSAEERAESPVAVAEEKASAPSPARRVPGANRRGSAPAGSSIDPAMMFKFVKWAAIGVVAILLLWALKSIFSSAASDHISKSATPVTSSPVSSPQSPESTITVVALDAVRVKVAVKNPDGSTGDLLLPDTMLMRGESRTITRRGTIYLTANALENVAIEENGRRTNIRDQGITGYSRVQIGR
jgi:transcriptional regulator with XRE-family HTH domain